MNDLVVFKKTSKEWTYGKIVRIIINRCYIILDNFGNNFRRNRRFIAKTVNNDIDSSKLLLEENIKTSMHYLNDNNLKEKQINIPIINQTENINSSNHNNNVMKANLSVNYDLNTSESYVDCETYDSDSSQLGASHQNSNQNNSQVIPEIINQEHSTYLTRADRISKPPVKYGT